MSVTRPARRSTLKAAACAALATATALLAAPASAADRLVVGTWGGDYVKLVAKNIGDGVAKQQNVEIVYDEAAEPPRQTKMLAERVLPRGSTDLQALINVQNGDLVKQGVLQKLDFSQIPNAANLLPVLRGEASTFVLPQVYSGMVILYNPELIKTPPKGMADLFKPGYIEKLGLIDIQYMFNILAASMAATGKPYDTDAAQALLMKAKSSGVKIVPTNEAMAQALKTGEVGIAVMWKARAVQWQNAGIPIKTVAPSEGVMLYVQGFGMPKNARNKKDGYAMLNSALSAAAQEAFARDMGYNPTVSNAQIPAELRARIGFDDAEMKRMFNPDPEFFRMNQAPLKEWWDKSFKG